MKKALLILVVVAVMACTFAVSASAAPSPTPAEITDTGPAPGPNISVDPDGPKEDPNSPQTGDSTTAWLISLALVAIAGASAVIVKTAKK